MGDGDGVEVFDGELGVGEGLIDDWIDGLDVGACGDFWDDAAVCGMDVDLGNNDVRQNIDAIFNNGGGRFVA